jgi:hypothetical protein
MKARKALFFIAMLVMTVGIAVFVPNILPSTSTPGNAPLKWRALLVSQNELRQPNLFPGVDLILSGTSEKIAAGLVVQPGAQLSVIQLDFSGGGEMSLDNGQNLRLQTSEGVFQIDAVRFYQQRDGAQFMVNGKLVKRVDGQVGVEASDYDPTLPLSITFDISYGGPAGGDITINAVPNITATKRDAVVGGGDANPGDNIKYTVVIKNTGVDTAQSVEYDDTIDPSTAFVNGTLSTTPLADDKTVAVLEDIATPVSLSGRDADDDNLAITIDTAPTMGSLGSVTSTGPTSASVNYTSNANKNGSDSFVFQVEDDNNHQELGTIDLNITAVNDAPVFSCGPDQIHSTSDGPSITVNGWATGIAPGPSSATDESGQVLTFNVTGNTNPAIFTSGPAIASNGNLTYTLAGVTGQAMITLELMDDGGTANGGDDTSNPCSFTIFVNGPPSAVADNYTTSPNTTISRNTIDLDDLLDNDNRGTPLANISHFGGGNLGGAVTGHAAGSTVSPLPTFSDGSLTVNANGSFSFTPPTGFTGNYTFDYRIANVAGNSDATVTISVQAGPTAVADNYFTLVNVSLSRNTSDPDDLLDNDNLGTPAATLTSFGGGSLGGAVTDNAPTASVALAGGTLTVNADGSFSLTTPTTTGSFTFQYRLTNVAGSSDATVTIEVRQAPTAVADSYNTLVNTTLSRFASDPDDLLDNDTRGFPQADVTHFGGGSLGGSVTDNNAGDNVAFAGGMLQVNADGSFTLTTPTTTGSFTFNYRITNVAGTSDATVTIEVRKAPTAVADNYVTTVNTTLTRTTANTDDLLDNDDRGFPLATIISFGGGSLAGDATANAAGTPVAFAGGTLTVNGDGSFALTTPTTSGSFSFLYRLSNVAGFSDATVTIEVQGAPTANDDSPVANSMPGNAFHTALNTVLNSSSDPNTPSVLANDNLGFPAGALSHFGGGSLAGAVTDNAAGNTANFGGSGSLQILATGEFVFTPDNNFTGLFTFQYRLTNTAGLDDATVTIAVGVRPAGVADAPNATGNVRLSTAANLLTNDTGDQLTVTAFDATSAQNGNVSVAANGTFTYNPPAGYEGADSFTYTPSNGFGSGGSVAVSITVSDMIWFINNTAGAGDGRLTSPFNTLAAFQAVNNGAGNNPAAGDDIFIYTGSGNYTGGVTLLNDQRLIGDGASGVLATILGITLAAGSDALPTFSGTDPVIENAGGNGITLAQNNTIRGLTVGNTPAANAGITGNGFGTLNVTDVSINGTGQILSLNNGAVNATFNAMSTTSTTQTAVVLSNISSGSVTDTDASNSSISGASGVFSITSGTTTPVSFTYNGDVTHAGANPLVIVQNHGTGTVAFQNGTMSSTSNGLTFLNADGTYNFNGTTTLSGAPRITISGLSSGSFNFSTNTSVTNPTNVAFDLDGSNAMVDYNGTLSSDTAFRLVSITNNTGGTASFGGNLSATANTLGLHIAQNTGGTFSFSGASKVINTSTTANIAVNVSGNTGAAISFANGGLDIDSNTGTGFNASDGSSITVAGATNSINTADGVAIDFDGPALNMTWASVSSASSSGAGIQLDNISGTLAMNGGSITTASGTAFDVGGVANGSGGSAVVTYAGSITNTAGDCIIIQELSGGSYTLSGNISHTGSGVGIQVSNVNNGTAATVTFSGTSKSLSPGGSNIGVNLSTNPNGTISFTNGGLAITTTSGTGFNASGGGTVSVTTDAGTANTISSTTGTALNVASTIIGASNLNFQSISKNGGTNGIVLTSTGSSGGLTVTGTGAANSGGTIQNTTGDAINLATATSISLTDMSITSSGGSWIDASSVTGLTLVRMNADLSTDHGLLGNSITNLTINGGTFDRGGAGNASANFHGVFITNLLGNSTVTGATFRRSNTVQFLVNNNTATNFAGTPDILTVTGTDWNTHNNPFAGDHLSLNSDTGGNFRLIVNSSAGINTVNEGGGPSTGGGSGVQASCGGTNGKMDVSVTGLKTTNNTAGVVVANSGGGTLTYNIFGNKTGNGTGFSSTGSGAIFVTHASTGGTSTGTINDNSISHTAGPGTNALQIVIEGSGVSGGIGTATISNNVISGNYQRGIHAQARVGTATLNLTLNNNTLTGTDITNTALQQINVENGGSGAGHANTICLNMLNNSVNLGPGATYLAAYRLINRTGCTYNLQNFAGNGLNTTDIQNWVTTVKSNTGTPVSVTLGPGFGTSAGCPTP